MNRTEFKPSGIFGTLSGDGSLSLYTLEHAYPCLTFESDQIYKPKIPQGEYLCVRGEHRIGKKLIPILTFEITGVSGHTGLLFHGGNFNKDSEGCVLLGWARTEHMILNSKEAFEDFMKMQNDVDTFVLKVT